MSSSALFQTSRKKGKLILAVLKSLLWFVNQLLLQKNEVERKKTR